MEECTYQCFLTKYYILFINGNFSVFYTMSMFHGATCNVCSFASVNQDRKQGVIDAKMRFLALVVQSKSFSNFAILVATTVIKHIRPVDNFRDVFE